MRKLTDSELLSRFEERYIPEPNSGCWLWTGDVLINKMGKSYGYFRKSGKSVMAHRFSFEVYKNDIPTGLQIDHLCCNTLCVNPEHLEPVSASENSKRHIRRNYGMVCKNGHHRSVFGTAHRKDGSFTCRECGRIAVRRYRERIKNHG